MAVRIPLITDFDGRGIRRAMAEFKQLEGTGEKTAFALKKAFLPAVAAVAGLAKVGYDAAQAAAQDEKAQAVLAGQLQRTTRATQSQISELEKWIETQGKVLGVADDQLRPALSTLATATRDVAQATKLATLAMDISAATGKPLEEVSAALGKAYNGQFKALQSLDPEIRKIVKSGASADQVFGQLNQKFGGAAQDAAGTTAGQMQILAVRMGELQEAIGGALLPVLDALVPLLTAVANWAANNPQLFVAIGAAIGVLATAVIAANAGIKAWNALTIVTTGLNQKLGTSFTRLQSAMGVVGLALTAAITVYSLVGKEKRDYKNTTDSLVGALKLEAKAQQGALEQILATDDNAKFLIKKLEQLGYTYQQLTQYVKYGTGPVADYAAEISKLSGNTVGAATEAGKFATLLIGVRNSFLGATDAAKIARGAIESVGGGAVYGNLDKLRKQLGLVKNEGGTGINKVAEAAKKLRDAFKSASEGAADALKKAIEMRDEFGRSIGDAIRNAVNFGSIQAAAKEAGQTFIAGLTASVAKAQAFGEKLQELMRRGLKKEGLAQIAQAGAEAGTLIADELLAGGAAAIEETNKLTTALEKVANETGTLAGATYYNEGVVLAQQLTQGITDIISKYKIKLSSAGLTEKQLKRLRNRFAVDVDFVMQNVPALADGGIVTSPTLALIGEAGPEAVVPLSRGGAMGNVTINVNGGDPNAVVDALRTYMRQNGSVPIRTSNIY